MTDKNEDILNKLYKARFQCAFFISTSDKSKEKLLPIFERIEHEIQQNEKKQNLISKALKIANDNHKNEIHFGIQNEIH